MKKIYLSLLLIFFLVGCAKETPQCSDEKTLDIVRQILSEEMNLADPALQKEVFENLKFELTKASSFDKTNKKYLCESKLISGGNYQVPIKYQSQLGDNEEHLVAMNKVDFEDISKLKAALLKAMNQKSTNNGNGVKDETQNQANNPEVITSILGVANPSFEQLLNGVYQKYIPSQKCWIATDENRQNYCMKIDSFDKVNVKGVNRFYAILSGTAVDDNGEDNGSHASSGLVAAFIMEENAKQLNLIASNSKIAMGSWGGAPRRWELIKIGPDGFYGWKNQSGFSSMGDSVTFFHILAPYGAKVKDIAGFKSGVSDEGSCARARVHANEGSYSAEPCTTLDSSFEFDTSKTTEKVFPLIVTVEGKDKGVAISNKKYNFNFDEKKWAYTMPSDYILKDRMY